MRADSQGRHALEGVAKFHMLQNRLGYVVSRHDLLHDGRGSLEKLVSLQIGEILELRHDFVLGDTGEIY